MIKEFIKLSMHFSGCFENCFESDSVVLPEKLSGSNTYRENKFLQSLDKKSVF